VAPDAPLLDPVSAVTREMPSLSHRSQHTLKTGFERTGIGLHTGEQVRVRVLPAPAGQGRYFVRIDLPSAPEIAASVSAVHPTLLSTELSVDTPQAANVRTVEHLLAALVGMGIDNARIEVDGAELPLLDGSAQGWVDGILEAGWLCQDAERIERSLPQTLSVYQDDAFAIAIPAPVTRLSYGIDFAQAVIGRQWFGFQMSDFYQEIAPARTFGFAEQVEQLRHSGLIKGGSLENALVCNQQEWLNPPLRFTDEPVRHKLLDFLGDLSLLGSLPTAHYLAYKASHRLHTQLAQKIASVCAESLA
jgi:UDP-3-O-[3-hydroxymyristoyl] N-acetylglucosamine deacetylase